MSLVFLSAALFSTAERDYNRRLAADLRSAGFQVFVPQEIDHQTTQDEVFQQIVAAIGRSDLILAVIDGPDVDSGVSWEIGYAHAKGKPIVGLRTDFRNCSESQTAKVNLMIQHALSEYLEDASGEFGRVIHALKRAQSSSASMEKIHLGMSQEQV